MAAKPPDLRRLIDEALATGSEDRGEIVRRQQAAEAVLDRAEEADAEADPGLGVRVAVGRHRSRSLRPLVELGYEIVHLAHVLAHVAAKLGVLAGLAERLDPELVGMHTLRAEHRDRLRHREQPLAWIGLVDDDLLDRLAEAPPHLVEAGEVEVALAAEVPVEDRLADAGGAGDVSCSRAAVAPRA